MITLAHELLDLHEVIPDADYIILVFMTYSSWYDPIVDRASGYRTREDAHDWGNVDFR